MRLWHIRASVVDLPFISPRVRAILKFGPDEPLHRDYLAPDTRNGTPRRASDGSSCWLPSAVARDGDELSMPRCPKLHVLKMTARLPRCAKPRDRENRFYLDWPPDVASTGTLAGDCFFVACCRPHRT